jgi:UDP-glucuronate 4-epimerase
MIQTLETAFNKKAIIKHLFEQIGDVPITFAGISKAEQLLNYIPKTNFKQGIANFKNWLVQQ